MHSKSATSSAIVAAEAHFQTPAERHENGSGLDIIAAQRDVVIAKTARLKAARMAQEAVQAELDAEARRNAPPKLTKKRVPKA
jgi:dUTPase